MIFSAKWLKKISEQPAMYEIDLKPIMMTVGFFKNLEGQRTADKLKHVFQSKFARLPLTNTLPL